MLGAIATYNVHPFDLEDENRWRYAEWQDDLIDLVQRKGNEIMGRWK
jgi:hypothetical protein